MLDDPTWGRGIIIIKVQTGKHSKTISSTNKREQGETERAYQLQETWETYQPVLIYGPYLDPDSNKHNF